MRAMLRLPFIIAITALRSGALNEHDTGVCSKRETTVIMETETFMSSYAVKFETCTVWVFCSTKYRTEYRTSTRSVYRTVEIDFLTCCSGYVEVEDTCKSKAPVTVPTSSSPPTSSPAFTFFSTSPFSLSKNQSTNNFFATLSNIPVENEPLPLTMTMMISGVVVVFIVIGVLALILIAFVFKRRKRERFQNASSPLESEGRRNGRDPRVQYYAVIPENTTEGSGVVIGASPLNPSPSTVCNQSVKKKKKSHTPLSIKKISTREKERIKSNQDELDASNTLIQEDLSHYTDMNSPKTSTGIVGYTDMRSPAADTSQNLRCTYMSQESKRYAEMDTHEQSDGAVPQWNEDEAYDKLDHIKSSSIEYNCYDKLDRSHDLLWGSMPSNDYGETGGTPDKDSNEIKSESNAQTDQEHLYDHTQNKCLFDRSRENGDRTDHSINSQQHCQESEPTYYNETGDETQLPADYSNVSIYTNVS